LLAASFVGCNRDDASIHGNMVVLSARAAVEYPDAGPTLSITKRDDAAPKAIARDVLATVDDQFDAIVVFTTFSDSDPYGRQPTSFTVRQDVGGIGREQFDHSDAWGSKGRLRSFIDMRDVDTYRRLGKASDPAHPVYAGIAHEFGHQWLSHLRYVDSAGRTSNALLDASGAHWAPTVQTAGSVFGGVGFTQVGGNEYRVVSRADRYSDLDLYAMGFLGASEVEPFYILHGVRDLVRAIPPLNPIMVSRVFASEREDITIDQVTAAEGIRVPAASASPHEFRSVFVLVAAGGESPESIRADLEVVDAFRRGWEAAFSRFTRGRGRMRTTLQ
jgi:hypothetical protein